MQGEGSYSGFGCFQGLLVHQNLLYTACSHLFPSCIRNVMQTENKTMQATHSRDLSLLMTILRHLIPFSDVITQHQVVQKPIYADPRLKLMEDLLFLQYFFLNSTGIVSWS